MESYLTYITEKCAVNKVALWNHIPRPHRSNSQLAAATRDLFECLILLLFHRYDNSINPIAQHNRLTGAVLPKIIF